jgi:hypothetical protein
VRAGCIQQLLDGVSDRDVVAAAMQSLQQLQRLHDRLQMRQRRRVRWNPERMESGREPPLPVEQLFVAHRKQRSSQGREHRQLVVGPLDRGECRPDRFHFFAVVKRLAADEYMIHAARFERLRVRHGHVLAEADEPPEEDADVPGGNRDGTIAATFRHLPSARIHEPLDKRADRAGQRLLDRDRRDVARSIRLRHRQRHDRGLPLQRRPIRR